MEQLAKHFKKIAGAALTRHGFAYADLLGAWPEIAGPELSAHCSPEKLSMPRDGQNGGVLTLRARPGRALDVQYAGPVIVERVNRFCGFAAISAVKVLQGELPASPARVPEEPELDSQAQARLDAGLEGLPPGRLRDALSRLGRAAMARQKRSGP
jgi:hypothetical protein